MAGVAVSWVNHKDTKARGNHNGTKAQREGTVRRLYERWGGGLTVTCAILAAAPDLDLLFNAHRTYTHSIGAVIIVTVIAALVARWRGLPVARVALTCGAAWGSHLLLDWLGADTNPPFGIMALWPFSHGWYISKVSIFDSVSRRYWLPQQFIWGNLLNVGWEVLVLAPIVIVLGLIRVKALARLASEMPRDHHTAE